MPERRTDRIAVERRKPTLILEASAAWQLMRQQGYTGCFIGHANKGEVKRIELPNPAGWDRG